MYKIKRFSTDIVSKAELLPSGSEKFLSKALFGGSSKSTSNQYRIYNSTVRTSYRLQSYIKSLDKKKLDKTIKDLRVKLKNGSEIIGSEFVEIRDSKTKLPWNFYIINSSSNPILAIRRHESWAPLIDLAMSSIEYYPDYYTYKSITEDGNSIITVLMTIDDYNELAIFLTMFSYYKNVYGNDSNKLGIIID